jgi:hypothetical protein
MLVSKAVRLLVIPLLAESQALSATRKKMIKYTIKNPTLRYISWVGANLYSPTEMVPIA